MQTNSTLFDAVKRFAWLIFRRPCIKALEHVVAFKSKKFIQFVEYSQPIEGTDLKS